MLGPRPYCNGQDRFQVMSTRMNEAQIRRLLPWSSVEARQGQDKDKARTRQGPRQAQYVFTNWLREERKEKSYATRI